MPRKKQPLPVAAVADKVISEAIVEEQGEEQQEPVVTPPAEPPKCAQCATDLTWRDRFYVGSDATRCKRCQQRGQHARLGVVAFHPATQTMMRGKKPVDVPMRHNRAARRGHGRMMMASPIFDDPQFTSKRRKPTRAERRANARKRALATQAA